MGAETGDDMTDVQEKSSQKKWHQSCILGNGLEFSDAKLPQPLVIFFPPCILLTPGVYARGHQIWLHSKFTRNCPKWRILGPLPKRISAA